MPEHGGARRRAAWTGAAGWGKEDNMRMDRQMPRATASLETRHRPWLDLRPRHVSCDRLVHVILTGRGAEDRLDRRGQVL